jgi:hypothetical protein
MRKVDSAATSGPRPAIDIEDTRVPAPMHVTVVGVANGVFRHRRRLPAGRLDFALRGAGRHAIRAGLYLAAQLKPGVSIEQARAEIRVLDRARSTPAQRDPQWLGVVIDVTPARTLEP